MTEIRLERKQICCEAHNKWRVPAWQKIYSFPPIMQTSGWDDIAAHIYRTSISKLIISYCVNRLDIEKARKDFNVINLPLKSGPHTKPHSCHLLLVLQSKSKLMEFSVGVNRFKTQRWHNVTCAMENVFFYGLLYLNTQHCHRSDNNGAFMQKLQRLDLDDAL